MEGQDHAEPEELTKYFYLSGPDGNPVMFHKEDFNPVTKECLEGDLDFLEAGVHLSSHNQVFTNIFRYLLRQVHEGLIN